MSLNAPPTFGELLKRYRLLAGLTQEALAERAMLSVRAITELERGRSHTPRPHTLQRLITALRLSEQERMELLTAAHQQDTPTARTHPASTPRVEALLAPIIGRERVLAQLEHYLDGEGAPLLLLTGEPGIGKSRLLQEVAQRGVARGYNVLAAGCQRRGAYDPYSPLLDALQQYLRGQTSTALQTSLVGCNWLVHLLPELADGPLAALPAQTLPAAQQRRLMFAAVTRFLRNVAGTAGTLLVLDDLQWAGSDALDLLASILHSSTDMRLRIVGAYRDTEVHAEQPLAVLLTELAPEGLVTQIELTPLTEASSAQLLNGLLVNVADMERDVQQQVIQRAGGVPFFLVSYAQGLRTAPTEAVPWSVAQSVRQRIAVLPAAARHVLEVAAIAGRHVRRALLVNTMDQPAEDVYAALDVACRARLIVEDGDSYQFAHDVIREVIEADLGAGQRARLHRRIAHTVEMLTHGLAVETLAYHYSRSDIDDLAAQYNEQAGDHAQERQAYHAALPYYEEAISRLLHLGRSLEAARVQVKLGTVLRTASRRYTEALAALEAAAETFRAAGDLDGLCRATTEIGYTLDDRGEIDAGLNRLEQIRTLLEANGSHLDQTSLQGPAMLYAGLARLYLHQGRYMEHLAAVERTAKLARAAGDTGLLAVTELNRALALLAVGRGSEGLLVLEEGSRLALSVGNLSVMAATLSNVAAIALLTSEIAMAQMYAERAREAAERIGDAAQLAFIHFLQGQIFWYMGNWHEARMAYELGMALRDQPDPPVTICYPVLGLGMLALSTQALDEAAQHLEAGLDLARKMGDEQTMRYFHTTLAERELIDGRTEQAYEWLHPLLALPDQPGTTAITSMRLAWFYLEQNSLDEALNVIAQAITRSRAEHCLSNLTECLWMQARIAMRQSRYAEAAEMLHEALTVARSTPYVPGEVRVLRLYAELHLLQGDWRTTQAQLTEVLALCRRLGADRITAQIEQSLAALSQKQIGGMETGTWRPVSDAAWSMIKPLLPPVRQGRGRPRADDRRTLDAILWVQQTGNAWSDLPHELGDEATAHRRLREWQTHGIWSRITTILQTAPT